MSGRVEEDADGLSAGGIGGDVQGTFCSSTDCDSRFLWMHHHSPIHLFLSSSSLPPLCFRRSRFISVCLPPFFPSAFMPLCFVSVNHPFTCLRFRTFPYLVLFCFCFCAVLEAGTEPHLWHPQLSLEITAKCVHPSVFPSSPLVFFLRVFEQVVIDHSQTYQRM